MTQSSTDKRLNNKIADSDETELLPELDTELTHVRGVASLFQTDSLTTPRRCFRFTLACEDFVHLPPLFKAAFHRCSSPAVQLSLLYSLPSRLLKRTCGSARRLNQGLCFPRAICSFSPSPNSHSFCLLFLTVKRVFYSLKRPLLRS